MKKIIYLLKAVTQLRKLYFIPVFLLFFGSNSFAQLANINYSVKVDRIQSYEGGWFGPCWESGTEEYTAWGGFNDNRRPFTHWIIPDFSDKKSMSMPLHCINKRFSSPHHD